MDLLSLFDVLVGNSDSAEGFQVFSDGIDAYKSLSCENKNLQPIIKYIDKSVNADKTDLKGLQLLSILIQQSSAEVLNANLDKWIVNIRKVLRNDPRLYVKTYAAKLLCKLFSDAAPFPDLHRAISLKIVPKLLQELLVIVPELPEIFLLCLQSCMQNFPGSCGPFRKEIDRNLLTFVGSKDKYIVKLAAACYSLMPTVGSGGNQNAIHIENWQNQFKITCNTLSQCLDTFLAEFETEDFPRESGNCLDLPNFENLDSAERFGNYYLRAQSLCVFISEMLREPLTFSVNIPLGGIMRIVLRLLSLNVADLTRGTSTDVILLGSALPNLQIKALNIWQSLFSRCQRQILPQANTLNVIFSKILKSVCREGNSHLHTEKPLNELRAAAYQVLTSWISLRGFTRCPHDDTFVQHLMTEITPEVDNVRLNVSDAVTEKKIHGKKKMKVKPVIKTRVTPTRKIDRFSNRNVCLEALKCLRTLVYVVGPHLSQTTVKNLQDRVVSLIGEIQAKVLQYDIPYDDCDCRLELYKLLQALTIVPHAVCPVPLNYAVGLFSRGRQDRDEEVRSFCREAAAVCGVMVCPLMPPMFFSPPVTAPSVSLDDTVAMDVDMTDKEDKPPEEPRPTCKDAVTSTNKIKTNDMLVQTEAELEMPEVPVGDADITEVVSSMGVPDEELAPQEQQRQEVNEKVDEPHCRGALEVNGVGEDVVQEKGNDKSREESDDDLKVIYEDPGVPWVHTNSNSSEDSCHIIDEAQQAKKRKAEEEQSGNVRKRPVLGTGEAGEAIQEMVHNFVDCDPD